MTQRDGQSSPSASTTTLDRPDGYAQRLGRIGDRETLHIDEHYGRALVEWQLAQGLLHDHSEFAFSDPIPWVGGLERLLFAQWNAGPGGSPASKVKTGVDHDPVEPGSHGGLTAEGRGISKR